MAYRSDAGKEPLRQQPAPPDYAWRRPSDFSDVSELDSNPYREDVELLGRGSVVSLDSRSGRDGTAHNLPAPSWSASRLYSNIDYAPVSGAGKPKSSPWRQPTRVGGSGGEYDLSLLSAAAPMGTSRWYEPVAGAPTHDLATPQEPITQHDEWLDFFKTLQTRDVKGGFTGGVGQGTGPDSTLRDEDLLSSPVRRNLPRSISRRISGKGRPGRAETIRHRGQDEANRRGEVIEVIMEEPPSAADLSTVEGSGYNMDADDSRRPSFAVKKQTTTTTTQVFYPQSNWKPWSMRAPYMALLVLLSIGTAIVQELGYRFARVEPLLTFTSPNDILPGQYFAFKFAPTLVAVVYGVLWQFTDFEVRRLEAYYQLSKPGGALAAESINVDYVTSVSIFRPYYALRAGHYAVALSSLATTLAISLVPTFSAVSVVVSPDRAERLAHPEGVKSVSIESVWSRLLTSTLLVCAALGIALFYLLQTRRSGLQSDVRGIAGLASMAVASHILTDFKDTDTAKHNDIHKKLKRHRYTLCNSSIAPDEENPVSSADRAKYKDSHLSQNPHPLMLRPEGAITFVVGVLLFTGFIPICLFTGADVITEKAPWLITALAVCLKLTWNGLETSVRMMEPYYILSRRHAPAKTLTLDYSALPFGYLPIKALSNGHVLVFLVGFGSVMTEFLTIMVTSLASADGQVFLVQYSNDSTLIDSGTETIRSFYLCFTMSIFTLVYMGAVASVVFVRRRHPFLPRQPNTIASVLAYIHQSKMLYTFVGTAKLNPADMLKKLEDGCATYGLGWFEGRDGLIHCGVDQEELTSYYKHGIDFAKGTRPWDTQWETL